ncbi:MULTISPECIES: hypothetical protein [Streptomyces]|uniref:Uncharacterized protein n=1 Tax=Streptomyces olivaceiscleroticus TaxID=68245 RepID=A0ABN0ZE39_9ACTN|nr:hypothetical protein [Streptomyces niger]
MTTPSRECVVLDIPQGLRLDLLGLVVEIGQVRIVADRAGLLGNLIASLTCGGGTAAAQSLEALAQMLRTQEKSGGTNQHAQDQEVAGT